VAAVVNIVAVLPGSLDPAAGATLTIEHVTGADTPGHTGAGEILGEEEFTLDENGEHTLNLEPCVDDLEGSIYIVTHGRRKWRLQPLTDGEWLIGDSAIAAPPGAPAVQYIQGAPGGTFLGGTLAARPSAGSTALNTGYHAEDDNGGTFYRRTASATWEQAAPSVDDVGGIVLASVAPTSMASINPAFATPTRIPEWTTGNFTMPDKPVRAIISPIQLTTAADPTFTFALHFTTNGWTGNTQMIIVNQHLYSSGTSRLIANISGRVTATAGATVQVGLFVTRLSGASAVTATTGGYLDVISF
jgi:hypothetical protein